MARLGQLKRKLAMVGGEPFFKNEAGTDAADGLIPEPPVFRAAQRALPFVSLAGDGTLHFSSPEPPVVPANPAELHIEGERSALALMNFYREYGQNPRARLLPEVLRNAWSIDPGAPESEYFAGFARVLDAMLAFAARQCDLERYVADLGAEHHRTLAAWNGLAGNGANDEVPLDVPTPLSPAA